MAVNLSENVGGDSMVYDLVERTGLKNLSDVLTGGQWNYVCWEQRIKRRDR